MFGLLFIRFSNAFVFPDRDSAIIAILCECQEFLVILGYVLLCLLLQYNQN